MDDLISRQAAIDVLHGYFDGMLETDTVCSQDLYNLFEIIPSAHSEIIYCQDCATYDAIHHYCNLLESEFSINDFCSYAERK